MATIPKSVSFRSIAYADIIMLRDWISRPHVLQWWPNGPSVDEITSWCSTPVVDLRREWHYIAMLGSDPVGFIQTYIPVLCHEDGWWLAESDPGVRGIDQFLANAQQLGQGLGTMLIRAFAAKLFNEPSITRIQCDPAPNNHRAIRCYEKAGFYVAREIVTPDGPAILMYCDRS